MSEPEQLELFPPKKIKILLNTRCGCTREMEVLDIQMELRIPLIPRQRFAKLNSEYISKWDYDIRTFELFSTSGGIPQYMEKA